VFHWISHPEQVVRNIHHSLKPNGRLVMEFGGKGNVSTIVEAIRQTLLERGIGENRNPWVLTQFGGIRFITGDCRFSGLPRPTL
jgi:hypothetical protein